MKNKMPYSVDGAYFSELENRLLEIPSSKSAKSGPWKVVAPCLAFAASLIAIAFIGNLILSKTAPSYSSEDYMAATDDVLVEYLIDSGTTLAQVEYYESL